MTTAKEFTVQQAQEFGMTKLAALLPAPVEQRPQLLEASKNESVRETKLKVKALGRAKPKNAELPPSLPPKMPDPKKRMMTVGIQAEQKVTLTKVGTGKTARWTGELESNLGKQKFSVRKAPKDWLVLTIKTNEDRW